MRIGVIAGNFDVIHPGYIKMFKECKNNCDHFIVLLQEDPSLERPEKFKPILSVDERREMLLSLKMIDEVITYTTEHILYAFLKGVDPDVRFLGDDYIGKDFTGKDLQHVEIYYNSRKHSFSTTELRGRVIDRYKKEKK